MDMPPVPIMETEKDARPMQERCLFEKAEDARVRLGYLKETCQCITKRKIGQYQDEMNENDVRMPQDIRFWWDENQWHRVWMKLDDALMQLATDPNSSDGSD